MARTAPVPNMVAIPGMNPGLFVLGGGGDGGGSGAGSGKGGAGKQGAGGKNGGKDATGDGRGAPDYKRYPDCGYASHPVDVVTGRAFTHPVVDLALPGPLPLTFSRMYSSSMADRDQGLGHGWGHSFGWQIEARRRTTLVWNEQGTAVRFPRLGVGESALGPFGWVLRRDATGYVVDADDGLLRTFLAADGDAEAHLSEVRDRSGNRIALAYEDGRLASILDSAGRTVRVETGPDGRIRSIAVKNAEVLGRWVVFARYVYDAGGNLVEVLDADGFRSVYTYDDRHLLCSDEDRTGLVFHFVHDGEGRCVESWGTYRDRPDPSLAAGLPDKLADGTPVKGISHCHFHFLDEGYSEVADSARVRRFFGNAAGQVERRIEGPGVVSNIYDDRDHLVSRTDELGATTTYRRDARGRLLELTDALGHTLCIERDEDGEIRRVTDPEGGVTTTERDAAGRPSRVVDPTGHVTRYVHDPRGLLLESIDAHGHRTRSTYDAQGNVTSITEPNGAETRYRWDALGRLQSMTDASGAETRYSWSDGGKLLAVHDAAGGATRYTHDGEGHVIAIQSPAGRIRRFVWGGYHKLCAITDEEGRTSSVTFDLDGFPVALRNEAGEEHRFEHGPTGALLAETTFDGRTTVFEYDLAGRLSAVTEADGRKTEMVRDALGRVVRRLYPDDTVEHVEYDACGRLRAVSGPEVEVRYDRDAAGRVLRESVTMGGETWTVTRSGDAHGQVVETSLGFRLESTAADDHRGMTHHLAGSGPIVTRLDALGRETECLLPGGAVVQSQLDVLGRVVGQRVLAPSGRVAVGAGQPEWIGDSGAAAVVAKIFRYDADSRMVEATDARRGSRAFDVDAADRLRGVIEGGAQRERYDVDAAGNITVANGIPLRYGPGNRLLARGNTLYSHDDAGRLIEKREPAEGGGERVWRYAWDAAGRLAEVLVPDGRAVTFGYDPMGRRVRKSVSRADVSGRRTQLSETRFLWDGSAVVQEVTRRAALSGDPIVEERSYWTAGPILVGFAHRDTKGGEAGEWVHYVCDPSGIPTHLVSERGELLGEVERTAWGRAAMREGAAAETPLRFAGQYEDEETGLHYNHFRYYDPDTGRYISPDPVGLLGGLNAYRYAPDPLTMIDPFGLNCRCVMITRDGPSNRRIAGTNPPAYRWENNSQGTAVPGNSVAGQNIPQNPQQTRPSTPTNSRGKCAEPHVLTDYQTWLSSQQGPRPNNMLGHMQQNVASITPMNPSDNSFKAPCGYCGPMLGNMGLSNQVMTPQEGAQNLVDNHGIGKGPARRVFQ